MASLLAPTLLGRTCRNTLRAQDRREGNRFALRKLAITAVLASRSVTKLDHASSAGKTTLIASTRTSHLQSTFPLIVAAADADPVQGKTGV